LPLPPAQKKPIGKAQQPEGGRSWPEAGVCGALGCGTPGGARQPPARKAGRTGRERAQISPRSADDKPAAQKPVTPAASAERRGGRHSSATAAGCARKGRGRGQSVKPTRARHVIFRAATSRSGFDARYTHERGDALNAARRCGQH